VGNISAHRRRFHFYRPRLLKENRMAKAKKAPPSKSSSPRRRTTFSLHAPAAAQVMLAGDFNDWDERRHPMRQKADGRWEKVVMLSPGKYEYKFLVDGSWETGDAESEALATNCFGTCNHVIEVKDKGR
jgi:1,4-alpha-glucan branching enzyme